MTEASAPSQRDRQAGVTLIEIVIALVVIGLTLALAATGLRLLAHSGERGAHLIERHDGLSRGIDVLRRDIERMERIVRKRETASELVFHGDELALALVAIEPPFPTEPGPYVLSYVITQRRDGATLTRLRAPFLSAATDITRLAAQDSVALLEGPYRLRFLYLDRKPDGVRWITQWTNPASLPALIALEVSTLNGPPMPLIVFRPRIDAELGCASGEGGSCTDDGKGAPGSSTPSNPASATKARD